MAEPPSSPPSAKATTEDALFWYKSQYEQLEHELSEFQASSKELETELEKDLDAADKRERLLQEKAEALSYEVDEWKRKYKESKAEANAAQNTLEKEITTLRDANRTLHLKLRDIEVANDDFERQARNTTSSLEDLESKYNVAIERAVMLEEEIKIGEQERERLRVEAQRLREELSDLKIEADILQDKLKKYESRHLLSISTSALDSPGFAHSPNSTASSPLILTPPDSKTLSIAKKTVSDVHNPPSPPMSDVSAPLPRHKTVKTPATTTRKSRLPSVDHSITPKPKRFGSSISSRPSGARLSSPGTVTLRTPAPRGQPVIKPRTTDRKPATDRKSMTDRKSIADRKSMTDRKPTVDQKPTPVDRKPLVAERKPAASASLTHIRSLTAQMQRLEARVQSARSKLPAPGATPSPRSSGIPGSAGRSIPSTVTIRSRKQTTGSTASSVTSSVIGRTVGRHDDTTPSNPRHYGETASSTIDFRSSVSATTGKSHVPRLSSSGAGVSRLSFGPLPNRTPIPDGPETSSRPSSRASISSYASGIGRPASRTDSYSSNAMLPPRPMSRTSLSGTRTPLGRPRSSLGGSMHGHGHGHGHGHNGSISYSTAELDELADDLRTPSRRGTLSRLEMEAGIPAQSAIPLAGARRQSIGSATGRRKSMSGVRDTGGTGSGMVTTLEDVGETY